MDIATDEQIARAKELGWMTAPYLAPKDFRATCKAVSDRIAWSLDIAYDVALMWVIDGEKRALTYEDYRSLHDEYEAASIEPVSDGVLRIRERYNAPELVSMDEWAIKWLEYAKRLEIALEETMMRLWDQAYPTPPDDFTETSE